MIDVKRDKTDAVGAAVVVGAGIAGIQAALDLADSGIKVYLVEKSPAIGGHMAQLDKTFPTNDCSMCIMSPKLVECGRHRNIELLTCSDLTGLEGEAGNFTVKVRRRARYVDPEKCTACGDCEKVCPVSRPNAYDEGLSQRKAIYKQYAQCIPNVYAIDKRGKSPCRSACPVDTPAQGYAALIREGKYEDAYRIIREVNALPGVCGRVCTHPCESACQRGDADEPISIAALKRFVVDEVRKRKISTVPENPNKGARGKSVAIVGSGPGGLQAANDLALLGYDVKIYEALPRPGGMLAYCIPEYRLPNSIVQGEIADIQALGVEVRCDTRIGDDLSLDDLRKKHEAVFLATGADVSRRLGIEGEEAEGVIHAVNLLRDHELGKDVKIGGRVVVVGGGNAAIDAARTCLRLGADDVTILYRRTRMEMPAAHEEIEEAIEEGVRIEFLAAPTKVLAENGKVTSLQCIRMELGEPDESGRRRPAPIAGSEHTVEANVVIPAISQDADLGYAGEALGRTKWGTIQVDDRYATNIAGVFAGGDACTGPDTVIEAMGAGKRAAQNIHRYLQGEELIAFPKQAPAHYDEVSSDVEKAPRQHQPMPDAKERVKAFDEVRGNFTEEQAKAEAARCLNCAVCSECKQCVIACKPGAILHGEQDEEMEINAGAVLLTPGCEEFDATLLGEYGYGRLPNVVTSIEFERILSATGPHQGHVLRPSDHAEPKKVAWLQCVGSRDHRIGRDYCSSVCCMYATKEAVIAKEHAHGLEPTIFFMDMRCFGKGFEQYYNRAKNEYGVRYIRSRVSRVEEDPKTRNLLINYEDESGELHAEAFDMVVLSVGLGPPEGAREMAEMLGIALDRYGFVASDEFDPLATSREGVFAAGPFCGPKDIPETVMEASAGAARIGTLLAGSRGTLTTAKTYAEERDVAGEPPRIGVFICHCGINIGGVVDVPAVVAHAKGLPFVRHAEENLFTCAQDTQENIKKKIEEHGLNRIVVASCTPRTHEPLFQETMRECGLNPHLFEMANIRDQCSWVHMQQPEQATAKAKDLVRMAVRKAALLTPLHRQKTRIIYKALVIGGGVSGMTAALSLADMGYEVALVEREEELGGNARHIHYTANGENVRQLLVRLIGCATENPKIQIYTKANVTNIEGFVGNYKSTIKRDGQTTEFEHGVVIVATGAAEKRPEEFEYGKSDRIITQRELERRLADRDVDGVENFVMIQCVGCRNDERPYCSRICCQEAVKNALKIKELNPEARVFVLYRDLRTYGLMEDHYAKAREQGVLFVRYDPERPPDVQVAADGAVKVLAFDPILQREVLLPADLLALSMATVRNEDNFALAKLLKVPLDSDGFFLEAHMKLRPVDFSTDGVYLCGLAHGPKLIPESIAQAEAAAGRAAVLLGKEHLETEALVSYINPKKCEACGLCVALCPYKAIEKNEKINAAEVNPVLCKGCGVCAASCRSGAPDVGGFTDAELLAQIKAV
ncbi:MAG: NAD(P)-binding protein [Planctomycetota bacterium]